MRQQRQYREQGARPTLWISATHGVLVESADQRLRALQAERLLVTDTLPSVVTDIAIPIEVVSIADLLAEAITRLHGDQPLDDLVHYV